jgi:hypothetical protein
MGDAIGAAGVTDRSVLRFDRGVRSRWRQARDRQREVHRPGDRFSDSQHQRGDVAEQPLSVGGRSPSP